MTRARGFTLIEMMIALTMGLIVVLAMTQLMANTLGTGTRTIELTHLTQELRSAMQLMSRDVRRASYSSEAILCFANIDCATDGSVDMPGDIHFGGTGDCFIYLHDRNHDGNATNDGAGGFRLRDDGGVGVLETWIGNGTPACNSSQSDWLPITEPTVIDVHTFQVDDNQSHTEVIDQDATGNDISQKVRKVHMRIGARLTRHPQIDRVIEDTIRVRNDVVL